MSTTSLEEEKEYTAILQASLMAETNGFDGDNKPMQEEAKRSTRPAISKGGQLEPEQQKSKKGEASSKKVPFYKLFSLADSADVALMIVGTIGAVGNGLCMPFMTLLFGETINSFGQNQNKYVVHVVSKVALKFVYLALIAGVVAFLQVSCWMVTGERQAARIRSLYFETIIRQDITFFDKEMNTGEVVSRMSGDTILIQDAMGEKVGKFIQLVSTLLGGFMVAFIKGWLLTLVLLSCIPLFVITGVTTSIAISKESSAAQNAYAKAAIVVEQAIGSIRTVASFCGEKHAITKYDKSLRDAYKSGIREGLTTGLSVGVFNCIANCTYSLAMWFGARMIVNKRYAGGDVINVIVAVVIASRSLGQISPCITAFSAGQVAAFKMFVTINRKPEIDIHDIKGKKSDDICGDIELRDIYFSYPTRPDEQILNGFSLSITSCMTTAMVGESGSGKSTVISLIQRYYDPQVGQVLIDGINLKDFQLKWVRSKIGLVSQEPVLFSCSIKDNIAYGKDGATLEEIKAAVEVADAAKFISILPQGLDTMVGEQGIQLSGGQKQRVAIARAILKDPRILLLDEATSALDVESERVVQEALEKIMFNRTTVIVAHRLSTIKNANMIAVIHQGKLVEKGSHTTLLEDPEGAYSQLIRLQDADKDSEQVAVDLEKSDSINESGRQASQRIIFLHSTGCGSCEIGNSNYHQRVSDKALPKVGASCDQSLENPPKVSLLRLAHLNKPEFLVLIAGAVAAIINGAILPTFGLLLAEAINAFFKPPHQIKKDSTFWALMFAILGIASLLAYPAQTYLFSVAGCKLIKRVRSRCFEKVVKMEVSWFDEFENSSGAIGARLSADAATIPTLVGDALALLVQISASAIAGLLIAFTACWQLAFIVLAFLPLMGLNGYLQLKFMQGFSADAKLLYEEASQIANDAVGSIRTVASFCAEEKVLELYKRKCEGPTRTGIKQGVISGMGYGASFALLFLFFAFCVYVAAKLVEDGKAKFNNVFRVLFALVMAALSISRSSGLASDTTKAKGAAASIFAIIDRNSNIDPSDESGMTLESVNGEIELNHISFKYPTRPDFHIFRDLNLTIQCGKMMALVGESGSGKSTVIALLQRFYDPESGSITLDGIELKRFQLKWLRQQMGLVSQEPFLFNETIRANIAYGKGGDETEAEILAASELANAHSFISGLRHGYDTIVGERGVQLSGGQKQRVAIARAIVKSPKILLLDEATSALDAYSERVVQDALDKLMVNQTTVVVAHRLSTIKNADVIAVVKNGVIVEKGRHDTLITIKDGFYASLVALHASTSSS